MAAGDPRPRPHAMTGTRMVVDFLPSARMNKTSVDETVSPDIQALKDKLKALLRHASISRLKNHADDAEVEARELGAAFRPGRILASNMVFILVSGDALRLTFKVHFETGTAKQLAFAIFGYSPAKGLMRRRVGGEGGG